MTGDPQAPGRAVSLRAQSLRDLAVGQVDELAAWLDGVGVDALALPCPGRSGLGDGSVAAVVTHTVGNYRRIGRLIEQRPESVEPNHAPEHSPGGEVGPKETRQRLAAARGLLELIAQLSAEQLDAIPSATEMRFVDGKRTFEQILRALLKHQRHQVDAITAARR